MTTESPFPTDRPDVDDGRPFHELRDTGLLWLINTTVFHPRGWALAIHNSEMVPEGGTATGWSLQGDGTEPWRFEDPPQELIDQGFKTVNQLFALVQDLLTPRPPVNDPPAAQPS